ncbi:MBOAT family O-acyltransferase [Oscillospiraceae bacterium PP1C4]
MELYSLSFVFLVLPASIALCCLAPVRGRPLVLLAVSALLYWWIEGTNILLPAAVILFDYAMAYLISKSTDFPRLRRVVMTCSVAKSVGLLVLYNTLYQLYNIHFPLGLGVICLTSTGYVIDCYKGFTVCERNPVHFALMTAFFPKLYAGPLVSANKLLPQIKNMRMSIQKTGEGAELFIQGLAKKIILGDVIYTLYQTLKAIPIYNVTTLTVWMLVVMLAFATYFILSGCCDMAKGLGLIFGLDLPKNFNHPYRSVSINDFFSRFNMTVNKFIRRYVYLNLGGTQGTIISGVFNILLVTILMGLWFGIHLNVLIWGIYLAVFIILERYVIGKHINLLPTLFRWIYSTAVILISFLIFAGDTPQMSFNYLKAMFGIGSVAAFDPKDIYLLTSNYLVLIIAAICSVGLPSLLENFFKRHIPGVWSIVCAGIHAVLLIVTVSFML